jgi:hypothetical protein
MIQLMMPIDVSPSEEIRKQTFHCSLSSSATWIAYRAERFQGARVASLVTERSTAVAVVIKATSFEMSLELACGAWGHASTLSAGQSLRTPATPASPPSDFGHRASSTRQENDRIAGAGMAAPTKPNLERTVLDRSGASQKPSARDVKG